MKKACEAQARQAIQNMLEVVRAAGSSPQQLVKVTAYIVGIANFLTFLERTAPYRRDLRRAEYGDERNPAMAERIDALHREGQRLLVAVGALHMTGPKALPALLQARGFRVERVDFR